MPSASYDATIIMPPMWHIREPWTAPAYICQALRSKGFRVQFLDYNIALFHICNRLGYGHLWQDGAFFQSWIRGEMNFLTALPDLGEIAADVVGIRVTQTSWNVGAALAMRIRKAYPHKKIIFGGHPLFFPEEAACIPLEAADAICKGEGEHTICEVMEKGFERIGEVAGVYVPGENGWQLTRERPMEGNLDLLPWPRFEGIDLSRYGKRFLPLMGSRGCVGRCLFCPDRYRSPGYRTRSATNQVDELEYLSQQFEVEHFPYNDPLLNGNIKVLNEKVDEILRRGLKVQYGGNMMVRADMPEELFPKLRKSGMSVALIGVESGCADTLKHMRKRHTPEMAGEFIRRCHQAGIKTELNFILGFPTETEEHFQETCTFLRQYSPYIDAVISIMPLLVQPSDLYDQREAFGIVMQNGTEYANWCVQNGNNTLEVRLDRVQRFRQLADDLGLLEDHVMSEGTMPGMYQVPTPDRFLQNFRERFLEGADILPEERAAYQSAAKRLSELTATASPPVGPLELAMKAVRSLKKHGVRQSVRRGREWLAIHRR